MVERAYGAVFFLLIPTGECLGQNGHSNDHTALKGFELSRQQMDFTSRTLFLLGWRETLISPHRGETKDCLTEILDTD